MTISGGIKVFDKSRALIKDGASVVASSGDASADLALSMNRNVRWDSVGSDDTTAETFVITMASVAIDRIFIVDHNLKDFSITYGAGASSFANVAGIDGALGGGIVETVFAQDTAYYEFDSVTTTQINITATKTQTVDAEKHMTLVAVTTEIGTFVGFPLTKPKIKANSKIAKTQNGKFKTQKGNETFQCGLEVEYSEEADITILNTLYEKQEPFLIWLSGGKFGSSNFSVTNFKSWRLKDLYQVQSFGDMESEFANNVYVGSPMTSLKVREEI